MRNSRKPIPTVFLFPNGRQMGLNAAKKKAPDGAVAKLERPTGVNGSA